MRPVSLPETKVPPSDVPAWLRIAGLALRTTFIILLIILTFRVSLPQNETIATAYDTPNDLIRLVLGLVVCAWLVILLFKIPRDAAAYRTWFYIGIAAVPFAIVCLVYVW